MMTSALATKWLLLICIFVIAVSAKKGYGPGSQEYGYVDVRRGAHMFYWLYYVNTVPEKQATNRPLIMWLQGGPGGASTGYGNFLEFGTLDLDLKERKEAWTKHVNVLYVDNPVGAGFSYVDDEQLYVKNNHEISVDLITFTKAFFKKFSKFNKTPFYIFSESYGGKMAVQFAYDLYNEIKKSHLDINFKGIALGDSWISPVDTCVSWAPYLLSLSVVDVEGYKQIDKAAQYLQQLAKEGKWSEATSQWGDLEETVSAVTGGVDFYNVLRYDDEGKLKNGQVGSKNLTNKFGLYGLSKNYGMSEILNDKVKPVLKVIPTKVTWQPTNNAVFSRLQEDFMKPVINYVEKVLTETDLEVNMYSGQLDLIVDSPGTIGWVYRMKWPHADDWKNAKHNELFDKNLEGYYKTFGKFTFYWVRKAGHMVPADNPTGALAVLKRITNAS